MNRSKNHSRVTTVLLCTTCLLHGGTLAAPEQISPALPSGGGLPIAMSPDGSRVIYATNYTTREDSHLYSVRIDGSDAGSSIALSALPLAKRGTGFLSVEMTSSGRVVFVCSDSTSQDLFSNNVFGTDLQRLSTGKHVAALGTDDGIGFPGYLLSPDESRVAYRSPGRNGSHHIFSVPVDGGATVRITPAFPDTANVIVFRWVTDNLIAYVADAEQDAMYELYTVAADGTQNPTKINFDLGPAAEGGTGLNASVKDNFLVSSDRSRLLYLADPSHIVESNEPFPYNLYSAPIGGGPSVQLNPTGTDVRTVKNVRTSGPLVALQTGDTLSLAPVSPPEDWMGAEPLNSGSQLVASFTFSPDGEHLVYSTRINEKTDLYLKSGSAPAALISDQLSPDYQENPRVFIGKLIFGRDGRNVYYSIRFSDGSSATSALGQASLTGGVPQEPVGGVTGLGFLADAIAGSGSWIQFSFYPVGSSVPEYFVLNTSSNEVRQLLDPDGFACRPRLQLPSGRIVFEGTDAETNFLFSADPVTTPRAWRVDHGLPIDGMGPGAPTASPIGDGIPNLLKYALGLDPWKHGLQGHVGVGLREDGEQTYLSLSLIRPEPPPVGVTYAMEVSNSLKADSWAPLGTVELSSTSNGDGTNTVVVRDQIPLRASEQSVRFIRLKVSE